MGMPLKQKNINVHVDGQGFLGVVAEFEEPELAIATEDYRGGGMLGPVKIDLGLEPMEAKFKMGGHVASLIRKFGTPRADGVRLRMTNAYQRDDTGQVQGVEIFVGGRFGNIGFGTAKPGDDTEHEYAVPLTYYRREVDGLTEMEIDMLAGRFLVNGFDRYAEIMAIIAN